MKRDQLTDRVVALSDESGLPLTERTAALRIALTRIQMNVSPATHRSRKVKWDKEPLLRPSGNVMGKQKREAKSE